MADSYSLYLVRHAIAAERGEQYPDDAKRPLTTQGMTRFRKAVRGLAELDVEVDLILTSPFVRARQTADILSEQLRGHPENRRDRRARSGRGARRPDRGAGQPREALHAGAGRP